MKNSNARPIGTRHRVEVGPPDSDLLAVQGLDEQREHRPEEHDERETREEKVVDQERPFSRDRGVDRARRAQPVAPPGDETDPTATTSPKKPNSRGPTPEFENECTDTSTPERVRKVPRIVREKAAIKSDRFQTRSRPRRSWTITECR